MFKDKKQTMLLAVVLIAILIFTFYKENTAQKEEEAVVTEFASAEQVSAAYPDENPDVEIYVDGQLSESLINVLITVHQDVTDLVYNAVEVETDEDGKYSCLKSEELYSTGPLKSEGSLLVKMNPYEEFPDRAVTVSDDRGTEYNYYIIIDKTAGTVMLSQY